MLNEMPQQSQAAVLTGNLLALYVYFECFCMFERFNWGPAFPICCIYRLNYHSQLIFVCVFLPILILIRVLYSKAGINEMFEGHHGPITGIHCHTAAGPLDFSHLFVTSSFDWTVKLWSTKVSILNTNVCVCVQIWLYLLIGAARVWTKPLISSDGQFYCFRNVLAFLCSIL